MGDPIKDGLVTSLAHPGGDVTGSTFLGPGLVPKRVGLLKEVVPPPPVWLRSGILGRTATAR